MCAVLVQDEVFTGYSLRNLSRSSNLFQKKAYRQFFDVRDRYQHSRKSRVTSQCLLTQFQQNTINRLFNERHVVEQINFRSVSFPSSVAPPFDLLTLDRFLFAQPWQLKFSHGLARYLIILRSEHFCICMNKQQISSSRDERRRLSQRYGRLSTARIHRVLPADDSSKQPAQVSVCASKYSAASRIPKIRKVSFTINFDSCKSLRDIWANKICVAMFSVR